MAKTKKKATKTLTDHIVEQSKREDVYSFGDTLIGFQCTGDKLRDLIDEGLIFIEKDHTFVSFTDIDYLGNTIPFYFSQSHASGGASGWTDPAWALEQYELDKDCNHLNYVKVTDAIAYQMNSAAVAWRMSNKLVAKAGVLPKESAYTKVLLMLSAALLNRYKEKTVLNVRAISTFLGSTINDYSKWYFDVRGAWAKNSDKAHYIKRIDAFLDGKYYLAGYIKDDGSFNDYKKRKEDELVDVYIRRMVSMMKCAKANYDKQLIDEGTAE